MPVDRSSMVVARVCVAVRSCGMMTMATMMMVVLETYTTCPPISLNGASIAGKDYFCQVFSPFHCRVF